MDIDSKNKIDSNFKFIPSETKEAFLFLSEQPWLSHSGWYLAGGTALALQTGNRKSVDLDFFTTEKYFDNTEITNHFAENKSWETTIDKKNTIYGSLFNAKISFIAYPFFIPKQDFIRYGSIKILQPTDTAVMKVIAVSQRGRKRDFFDLFWCAKNIEPLESLIKRLKEQYPSVAHDYNHILKSLVYFEDAESDPEPEIYFKTSWKEVKDFFEEEIPKITKVLLEI
ncbi:MAG: nucleotidyl transferase AbiEii/AbiGii toxin family protein [bacterium]